MGDTSADWHGVEFVSTSAEFPCFTPSTSISATNTNYNAMSNYDSPSNSQFRGKACGLVGNEEIYVWRYMPVFEKHTHDETYYWLTDSNDGPTLIGSYETDDPPTRTTFTLVLQHAVTNLQSVAIGLALGFSLIVF